MRDAIAVLCSILYIELRINFRMRDLTAMRKQQTQAGEAKKGAAPVRYNRLGLRTFRSHLRHDNTTKMEIRIATAATINLRRDYRHSQYMNILTRKITR